IGVQHHRERRLADINFTLSDVFHDHSLVRLHRHTPGGVSIRRVCEEISKRLVKTTVRGKRELVRLLIAQLNMSLVCSTYFNCDVEDLLQTTRNVIALLRATSADFIQTSHRFEVGGAVFQDSKQARFALTQLFSAFLDLLFESVLRVTQLFLECLLGS